MDDWKLKTTPVVRLQKPNKTFVQFASFNSLFCMQCFSPGVLIIIEIHEKHEIHVTNIEIHEI